MVGHPWHIAISKTCHHLSQRRNWLLPSLLGLAFTGFLLWMVAATPIRPSSLLYLLYVGLSLILGVIACTTLSWMLYAWRTPESFTESRLRRDGREPVCTFSLIVPARHEQAVLEVTLERLSQSEHPAFEIVVVVGDDDPATREVAERVAASRPERVRVVIDTSRPKNKPKALNTALPHCRGTITGVFDAEDDVHPDLLQRVDQCFQLTGADIVQAGVQLMNFHSSLLAVHNVLEYYFWFRSRLHRHARQRFIPLGGNTVFIRTQVLRAANGWDAECLAEDCELGVRLSSLGAQTAVFYEPELVTREECPATLRAFIRQRTRWDQGYLETLSRGYWRQLPSRQRALGAYILMAPFAMAIAWVMIPVAIATTVALKAPIEITMISFLPAVPMFAMLVTDVVGLGEFCRTYQQRASARDYARLVFGLPLYQGVLSFAAARAVIREARGARGWEKTTHLGLHIDEHAVTSAAADELASAAPAVTPSLTVSAQGTELRASIPGTLAGPARWRQATAVWLSGGLAPAPAGTAPAGTAPAGTDAMAWLADLSPGLGNGHGVHFLQAGSPGRDARPLWARLSPAGPGHVPLAPPAEFPAGTSRVFRRCAELGRATVARLPESRLDLAIQLLLVTVLGVVEGRNMLHWPAVLFDEGTYVGNAWAVGNRGVLAFYTYTYGHPPLAWLLIALWTSAGGIFGHAVYSLDGARECMCMVSIVSFALLYTLARRLGISRPLAVATVLLFALSPLSLYFHRGVLLDNPATVWVIAAFVLALSPKRRLWSFAGSGACFAASYLSKETTLVILPALLLAGLQNTDRRTRRYCLTMLGSFLVIIAVAYPLYATLKGELIPGPGHVSLVGTDVNMLFTRQGTGSILNPHSVGHGTVTFWLSLDPWLVGVALAASPVGLVFRSTRAVAVAYLIQVVMVLRPGYLPAMYVIAMLPFAALVITGSIQEMWRLVTGRRPRFQPRWGPAGWRLVLVWAERLARPVAIAASVAAILAAAGLAAHIAPRWYYADRQALTVRLDGPQLGAEAWLLRHVGRQQRLIVTDDFWIFLIEHGFDDRPVKGGFNSPTVVSYWPLDKDPAVKRFFPYGWREFNYIVDNAAMRDTAIYTPSTYQALHNSRLAAVFGTGTNRIEIRAITPTPLPSAGPAGANRTYRTPALGGPTPSLRRVARLLRVSVRDLVVRTDQYPDSPAWWFYQARLKYARPLPPGTVLHYYRKS